MTAVLVIDMLNDYFRDGPLVGQRERLVRNINALVHDARARACPVIWVRQEFAPDLSDAFLVMRKHDIHITIAGTSGALLLDELDRDPADYEVVKKRYSAFHGTRLESLLEEMAVRTLVIAGINTHACVRMAAIDAYQRDYEVIVARNCVASPDHAHHEMTLVYLDGEIAKVTSDVFAEIGDR
ncbi:MAG: cysteine hydrolase, partial [Rhodothermales bacterium]|nr:cysteine hydrolase [Rhodothermales bacterium]